MKKTFILLVLALVLIGCHKDKELDVKEAIVSHEELIVSINQARFSWQVEFAGQFHTGVELSQNENMNDLRRVEAMKEGDEFVAVVDELTTGTKYYYRIVVWNKFSSFEQPVGSFMTTNTFSIHVSAEPPTGGTTTGGGSFAEGDTCTVVATANMGYNFVNWTENGSQVSTEAEYSFAVTSDCNLVAHFTSQEFTITATAEPEEGGTISGSGGYNNGDECTLTATANEGYDFVNWTKEDGTQVSTEATYCFIVTESALYVAHFQIQSYFIEVLANLSEGGTVSGGGTFNYGENCTLTATANAGYDFDHWQDGNTDNPRHITVTANATYTAYFTLRTYTITTQSNPSDGGTVSGGGDYTHGQPCTVTATANEGYRFVNWTENDNEVSTNESYTFDVNNNRNLVANFEQNYPIGAINGLFTINASGDQVYFSQGNLQYNATLGTHLCADGTTKPGTWRFATNQFDYVGADNANISQTYSGGIDLFGWGTSGWHDINDPYNVNYQPWSVSSDTLYDFNYYGYGPSTNMPSQNLTESSKFYDWGVYNAISNGGDTPNTWRTMTKEEWYYILLDREGSRYAFATVNDILGLILLPDNWDTTYYPLEKINSGGFNQNIINYEDWTNYLEIHGAVFLPRGAGCREGTNYMPGAGWSWYWTASNKDSTRSYCVELFFIMGGPVFDLNVGYPRYRGHSVRLVCPAE